MTHQGRDDSEMTSIFDVRPLATEDAPAVVALLDVCQSTWIHAEARIRQLAGVPLDTLVATNQASGELVGFLACGQVGEQRTWIRDVCVAPGHPWEHIAGMLVDMLVPGRTYEVLVRESDERSKELFRAHRFAGDRDVEHVWPNAFGDEAGIVMRRLGNA